MDGSVYRICRKCGLSWNVSSVDPGDKVYICPKCDKKSRNQSGNKKARRTNVSKKVDY